MSKKGKIVEYRCSTCKTLLLRGLMFRNGSNIDLTNIKPRKNAIIKNINFKAIEFFGYEYSPEDSVICNFDMDVTCKHCGKSHEKIISEGIYVTYKTYGND